MERDAGQNTLTEMKADKKVGRGAIRKTSRV